jgi:excisionase family DNA binding protein
MEKIRRRGPPEEHLSIADAAAQLGLSKAGVRYYIERGDIRAERSGNTFPFVSRAEVQRFMKSARSLRGSSQFVQVRSGAL